MYWAVKGNPWGSNRQQRRQLDRTGRLEGIDPLEFSTVYNRLEETEGDVAQRVALLLDWLREQTGDVRAVDKAYARAVQAAQRHRGKRPRTVLESKIRGEKLLRVDHARKLAEDAGIPPPPDGWPSGLTKPEFDEEMARQKGHGG